MSDISNDNDTSPARPGDIPDGHGEAAILLVESLIHALVARFILTAQDAIDLVTVAFDVKSETGANEDGAPDPADKALLLLSSIRQSLRVDIARIPPE
ncbi:hypothetical protein [Novosphingobium sp.]|uniref:hypothetical protein n=1 Tax=Novosphingobium sp. TaxID=1874826 RepID=UPI003B518449